MASTWDPPRCGIAGIGERLAGLGYRVVDKGDLTAPIPETKARGEDSKKYIREIARVCQKLYHSALATLEAGAFPLVLGGDHSLATGSVAAAADYARRRRKPLGLLWVDAHGDMNTPASTDSGNVHGMPLAAVARTRASRVVEHRRPLGHSEARQDGPHRRA